MLFAVPSSAVNSAMDYFTKLLGLAFRERLTRYFHEKYLQKMFYYKVNKLNELTIYYRYVTLIAEYKTQIRD